MIENIVQVIIGFDITAVCLLVIDYCDRRDYENDVPEIHYIDSVAQEDKL